MPIQRNRERLGARGFGKLMVRELLPTPGAFVDLGYLDETNLEHLAEMEIITDENGEVINVMEKSSKDSIASNLLQVSADEIDFIRNASGKTHTLRYFGLLNEYQKFQYYCFEQVKIDPSVARRFIQGKQVMPLKATAVKQSLTYDVPTMYVVEVNAPLSLDYLQLWLSPRRGLNNLTAMVLDVSGFARHGTLTSAFATIWQSAAAPERFLRFDGTVDALSLGDVLDDDATTDFMIETWAHIPAADGTAQEILGKKNLFADHSAGFAMRRETDNTISFKISDGDESATVASAATLLQNVWKHIAITIDRNGNGKMYINGAASGAAVSVAALETAASNALPFYLGAINGTELGQVDISDTRAHQYPSGLPADIATVILNHYTAEKTIHGL